MTNTVQARPAPYPADIRAKGWRFELDYEKIEQSDTWGLAYAKALEGLPLARPLLLATWYGAWKQTPCGSLPTDDRLLAAAIGIPLAMLVEYRDVLLRGWWLAEDGRLYHDTLIQRVGEMLAHREKEAKRVADWRAAKKAKEQGQEQGDGPPVTPDEQPGTPLVTGVLRVTPPLPTREYDTRTRTRTSNTSEEDKSSSSVGRAKRSKAATRVPADWTPSEQDFAFAESKGWVRVRAMVEAESFRNHYLAASGKGSTSPDWAAKWRTWVLNGTKWDAERESTRKAGTRGPPPKASRHSGFDQMDYLEGVTNDGRLK